MSDRLQGKEFANMRPFLKMVSWYMSDAGHIRVNLANKKSGKKYHHWLNTEEQEKFIKVKDDYPISIFRGRKNLARRYKNDK